MMPQVLVRSFRTNMWKSFSPEAREMREYDVWLGILEVTKAATFDVKATWKFLWWRFRYDRPSFRPDDALKCLAYDDGSPVILADDKKVRKVRDDLQKLLQKWYKMGVFSYDG